MYGLLIWIGINYTRYKALVSRANIDCVFLLTKTLWKYFLEGFFIGFWLSTYLNVPPVAAIINAWYTMNLPRWIRVENSHQL